MSKKKKRGKTGWHGLVATLEAMHCERQARMAAYEARQATETVKPVPELSAEQQAAVDDLERYLKGIINQHCIEFERKMPAVGIDVRLYMGAHVHENWEAE